ncbi:MAG: DUF1801 domain-containing protein [Gemmatimonadaceae bacterium]|nr:DUF1801 domain-containing protein [Gemmatimonadaceae bacterium]
MADTRLFPLPGGQADHPAVERWFAAQRSALATIARRWFDEMRRAGPEVTELLHDGHPTACVGDLAFGYVDVFERHVNVGFFLGTSLDDPGGLLRGTGRFMRHVPLTPEHAIDAAALRVLVRRAYADMRAHVVARERTRQREHEAVRAPQTATPLDVTPA